MHRQDGEARPKTDDQLPAVAGVKRAVLRLQPSLELLLSTVLLRARQSDLGLTEAFRVAITVEAAVARETSRYVDELSHRNRHRLRCQEIAGLHGD